MHRAETTWLDVVPSSNPRPWFPGNMKLCTWALANMAKYSALQNTTSSRPVVNILPLKKVENTIQRC